MKPVLENVSVDIKSGSHVAIIGKVGSGKSSFLLTIADELFIKSGSTDLDIS